MDHTRLVLSRIEDEKHVDTSLFRTLVLLFGVCVLPQSPVIAYDVSSLEYTNNIYAYIRGLYVTGSSLCISS